MIQHEPTGAPGVAMTVGADGGDGGVNGGAAGSGGEGGGGEGVPNTLT